MAAAFRPNPESGRAAERERKLPPGTGFVIVAGGSLAIYAATALAVLI